MKYAFAAVSMAAFAAAEVAINNNAGDFNPVEGQPWLIKYSGCQDTTCSIWLRTGKSKDSKKFKKLTGDATGTSTEVTLEDIPSDDYTLYIENNEDLDDNNYSQSFPFEGTAAPSTTAEKKTTAKPTSTEAPTSTKESTTEKTSTTSTSTSTEEKKSSTTSMSSASSSAQTTPTDTRTTTSESDAPAGTTTSIPGDNAAGAAGVPTAMALAAVAGLFFLN